MGSATARQGAAAVTLASIDLAVAVAVHGANHVVRDVGAAVTVIPPAISVAHRPHRSHLQSPRTAPTLSRCSPTTDRARRAGTKRTARKGKGPHASVQIEPRLQLEQGDVEVCGPVVVLWVCDLPSNTPALPIAVRCAKAMLARNRTHAAAKTMCGSEDPPVIKQGSTAERGPAISQSDLIGDLTHPCIPTVDDLDAGVSIVRGVHGKIVQLRAGSVARKHQRQHCCGNLSHGMEEEVTIICKRGLKLIASRMP